jgi:hypothetical protein
MMVGKSSLSGSPESELVLVTVVMDLKVFVIHDVVVVVEVLRVTLSLGVLVVRLLVVGGLVIGRLVVAAESSPPSCTTSVPLKPFPRGDCALMDPPYWTFDPGSGKVTSSPSMVLTSAAGGTLATKILGSALKLEAALLISRLDFLLAPLAVILTHAQSMYISLFPTLLNQVHARSACPAGAKEGTVKS